MSLILAWVAFPLLLAALGAGWGALVQRAADAPVGGALLIPLGLAAMIVVAGFLTAFEPTARAAVPVVAVGGVAGVVWARRSLLRLNRWPLLAALGALLAYGAPVLLSGSATFLGYIRLDDTGTWLNIVDHVMFHARSVSGETPSTYTLNYIGDVGNTYPLGAFMLLGIGHGLTGIDAAWIVQPYLAICGAAVGLGAYALVEPLVRSPRICALIAFIAAQPALLYGYAAWGGDKELAAAFLLVLGSALIAQAIAARPADPRRLLPLAVAAGALILTLGVGAGAYVAPALAVLIVGWVLHARGRRPAILARDLGLVSAATLLLSLPVWISASSFLGGKFSGLFEGGNLSSEAALGNLIRPLKAWQLAGIWPVGDFRLEAPTVASVLFIALVVLAAAVCIGLTVRRRQFSITAYLAIALIGCAIFYLIGSIPWIVAKSLAISSPALLTAALAGGGMLWGLRRGHRVGGALGLVATLAIGGGVLWSNALAYHDVLLAPRERLAELQHMGELVAGKGPTLINEYEIYADRHFLRAGAPVEPAEYRPATLPLRNGAILTKSAFANLDAFPLSTLEPYRSLVVSRSPTESRPPSTYQLAWEGRNYQLWQRPVQPATTILAHIPLGDSETLPYCGAAQNSAPRMLCPIQPVATPPCKLVEELAKRARARNAQLVAYQRPEPVAVRGDDMIWPAYWLHNPASGTLTATAPGTGVAHIGVPSSQHYELWLGGEFARGFNVSVDGRHVARVKDKLLDIGDLTPVAELVLAGGVHTFEFSYPHSDLTPGSGDNEFTALTAIALQPLENPVTEMLKVSAAQAKTLCGRPLDWIEIVVPAPA
jgi:hypothetical protein